MSSNNGHKKSGVDRRDFLRTVAGGAAAASFATVPFGVGCSNAEASMKKKVVVLGLDGLDPKIVNQLIRAGRAPNFKKLAEMGSFKPLQTTMPALSPVAWSSFITGMTPGGHGIADFIARDSEAMMPVFSIYETRDIDFKLELGDLSIPLAGGGAYNLRKGTPFWSYLTDAGIPSTIIKIPTNYPPDESATRAVSGMGTPDVTSTYGNFNYYTTDAFEEYPDVSGGEVHYVDVGDDGVIEANLIGPDNALLKPKKTTNNKYANKVLVPFKVYPDARNHTARIDIQGHTIVLNKGEMSQWIPVNFDFLPLLGGVSGICRFLLKDVGQYTRLYVSPINIDPANQASPVTWPAEYGAELADEIGPFWTKGLPSDTKALDYRIFNDEDYVKQAQLILRERLALFDYEWSRFNSGLFYFYVSNTDQDAHMLWRNMDPTHPMHDAGDKRFADYIFYLYEEMDRLVGKVLPAVDEDTLVLICSDHGFAQYGRQFHLNSWLRRQGWLKVKDEARSKVQTNVRDIDWSQTVAYGMGFNGLYLNLEGRESQGIVKPGEADKYVKRITGELEKIVDDETSNKPIHRVFNRSEVYTGDMTPDMPEMLVGYNPGFRCSADSVVGDTGRTILEVNPWAWSGDHSMSRDAVPGTLMSSRKVVKNTPSILDLPVSILDYFGLQKPKQMVGSSIYKA